jgi:phosphate transport system permease protein
MSVIAAISPRRRRTDRAAKIVLAACCAVAALPLVLILYYLLKKGLGAWSGSFFSSDPNGNFLGNPGGVKSALLGTLEMVLLAAAISIPLGIAVGLFLTEFGKRSRFAAAVRYFVDVMTGVPSIVFGLFIYIALVITKAGNGFAAGWKGSVALSLLMLPIVVRSSEVVLLLVPESLRESALALGAPRWRVIMRVVVPAAIPGLVTGALLAVARAAGETAPLLFTAQSQMGTTFDLSSQMNSLPAQIFSDVQQAQPRFQQRAWGAALTLVAMILVVNLVARFASRRSQLR